LSLRWAGDGFTSGAKRRAHSTAHSQYDCSSALATEKRTKLREWKARRRPVCQSGRCNGVAVVAVVAVATVAVISVVVVVEAAIVVVVVAAVVVAVVLYPSI